MEGPFADAVAPDSDATLMPQSLMSTYNLGPIFDEPLTTGSNAKRFTSINWRIVVSSSVSLGLQLGLVYIEGL